MTINASVEASRECAVFESAFSSISGSLVGIVCCHGTRSGYPGKHIQENASSRTMICPGYGHQPVLVRFEMTSDE